jgi:hypothetical protein
MKKIYSTWLMFVLPLLSLANVVPSIEKDTLIFPEIPKSKATDANELASIITTHAGTDEEKAYFIYYWIAHNIKHDVNTYNKETKLVDRSEEKVLKDKVGYSHDFAKLYTTMCKAVGLRAQTILGYEKNEFYSEGMSFYRPTHSWNAVLINYKWQLVDVYLAAGNVDMQLKGIKKVLQKINKKKLYTSEKVKFTPSFSNDYFLEDVEKVRLTRLPVDPYWQLTDTIMPLSVFEKTDEDIRHFNEVFSTPKQDYVKLSELNLLSENEAILESADRTYAFNPRYTIMKARKHNALGIKELNSLKLAKNKKEATEITTKAKSEINQAKEILNEQQQLITKEFSELRKVNTDKRTDVLKFKQTFTRSNNKYLTESNSKYTTASTKENALKQDATTKAKKANELRKVNFADIKTIKPELPFDHKEMLGYRDSISTRKALLKNLDERIFASKNKIAEYKAEQEKCMQALLEFTVKGEEAMQREAMARSKQKDSHSDSIKIIRSDIYEYKAVKSDSLQKSYFDLYDSILAHYDVLKQSFNSSIDQSKANAMDYRTIHKKNSSEAASNATLHDEQVALYENSVRGYVNNNISYINYLKEQSKQMKFFTKIYNIENDFFAGLDKREEDRKEHIKKIIDKNESMMKKHNQQSKEELTDLKKDIDKLSKSISKSNSKKKK